MSDKTHWAKTYRGGRFLPACQAVSGDTTLTPAHVTCKECMRKIRGAS